MLAGKSALETGPQDWPDGCINFMVNLVRPVQQGHRKKIFYRIFGRGLVFDSLDSASKYRDCVARVRTACQGCLVHFCLLASDAYRSLRKDAIVCCVVTLGMHARCLQPAFSVMQWGCNTSSSNMARASTSAQFMLRRF